MAVSQPQGEVDELIVCDPRRNRLISDDGDKADAIDAGKLAELLRGRHPRAVYHSENDQQVWLKQWVSLYHDRVREEVRQINKSRARCRMHGLRPPRGALDRCLAASCAMTVPTTHKDPRGRRSLSSRPRTTGRQSARRNGRWKRTGSMRMPFGAPTGEMKGYC